MKLPDVLAAPQWYLPAAILIGIAVAAVIWSYARSEGSVGFRIFAGSCKVGGLALLGICLLEPVFEIETPKSGANLFMILADSSQSLKVRDRGQTWTREQQVNDALTNRTNWQERLEKDFDVRKYEFDRRLRNSNFASYQANGVGSSIVHCVKSVAERYRGRPSAGIMLLTDGNATDLEEQNFDWSELPPIYPVVVGKDSATKDISISRFSVSQTNFETAPVSISAEIRCQGYNGKSIKAQLLDDQGNQLDQQVIAGVKDNQPFALRFQLQTQKRGINVYRVRVFEESAESDFDVPGRTSEATLINNQRLVLVDRNRGPYRILYVSGRPNWEYKFLKRALQDDDEIQLVGLIRIAKKEPKFTFRGHLGEKTNPLYRGFENQADEQAEQYDEPVVIRIGTKDDQELRNGFPGSPEILFEYDAIILDDLEADFFTQDQKSLIQEFVSARGGGLLMLGGQESFANGDFDRTPIGELLPVYLNRSARSSWQGPLRLELTREGWLQPWVRVATTQSDEQSRLDKMPSFKTVNALSSIKPGASVLSKVRTEDDRSLPALVVQRFGKGRSSALMIGDMWRWHMQSEVDNQDLMKSWRQMVRWLVAEVPRRVDVSVSHRNDAHLTVDINTTIYDESYKPLDNATVEVAVTKPDGKSVQLTPEPVDSNAGQYGLSFVPRLPGAYTAKVIAKSSDNTVIGEREFGWVSEPANDEFRSLVPDRNFLEGIAEKTGGEVIELDQLDRFVSSLPNRKLPVMETRIEPWWHTWTVFLVALALLVTEWGLRRWKGLA